MQTQDAATDHLLIATLRESGAMVAAWDIPADRVTWLCRPDGLFPDPPGPHLAFADLLPLVHPDDRAAFRQRVDALLATGEEYVAETRVIAGDGGTRWLAERGRLLRGADGTPLRLTIVAIDVTPARTAQEELRRSLEAQATLMREMNHRVKNSLQMVASLVQLHRMRTTDEAARKSFDDVVARVRAVAEVHRMLYQGDRLGEVDLGALILAVAQNVDGVTPGTMTTELPAVPLAVPVDLAIPVGLIANEIITNAAKHAYGGGPGPIRVSLSCDGDGAIRLLIADQGRGVPPGVDWKSAGSLGMMLLRSLTAQIDGELEFRSGPGGTVAQVLWRC